MRLWVLITTAIAGVIAMVLVMVTVLTSVGAQHQARDEGVDRVSCDAMIGPSRPGQARSGQSQAAQLDAEQRGIVAMIISIGKERDLAPRAWQIAIQAGMTESRLRNLDYGDRDSLGIFQMRPSMGWGTVAQVTDPPYQINKFYDVMKGVPDWRTRRPGDVAQAVERSAFPDRYHGWEAMAVSLVETMGDVEDAVGCGETDGVTLPDNEVAATAIRFALGERGKPYVWGATGPHSYDCSGLLLRAYESAGVTIPRVSRDQFKSGAMLPAEDAEPGDFLFWAHDTANPATIHHVAMYIGDGQIVEAQQSGVPVHTRDVSFDEGGMMPVAVRPGT